MNHIPLIAREPSTRTTFNEQNNAQEKQESDSSAIEMSIPGQQKKVQKIAYPSYIATSNSVNFKVKQAYIRNE